LRFARMLTSVTTAAVCALLLAGPAVAQVGGQTSQIPPTPPKNWSNLFVAWPLMLLAVILVAGVLGYYSYKMVKVRYQKRARTQQAT
jgi:heme/copper-type cytochrome/quinol oxidase subunit 2